MCNDAGFAVMASVPLANNAPALAAIVCFATLLIGPITLSVYKYAAFLFIITLHTIVLCQCVNANPSSCEVCMPCLSAY